MAAAKKIDLSVSLIALADLAHYERNARTHPQAQIEQIKTSIREFGFANPIIADIDDGGIIAAGHGRHMAVEQMLDAGETIKLPNGQKLPKGFLPVVDCSGWTAAQRRAYTLADNKIAENSGWDDSLLTLEIGELIELGEVDAPVIGFSQAELRAFGRAAGGDEPPEVIPPAPDNPVAQSGDVWILGDHRIMCGDSTNGESVAILLNGEKPHLMVTDPPYGVEYDADWRNNAFRKDGSAIGGRAIGKVQNDNRADWSEAYDLFPGEVAYVWHSGSMAHTFADSLIASGFEIRAQVIWAKNSLVISRGHYHPQHEPCWYVVRKGGTGHWQGSRKESTLWEIPKPSKSETGHSTQKPVECMARPIRNNSAEGEAVYEPFSGSGTTIIAGEIEARRVFAMELHPPYVDVAVLRWQEFSGKVATLAGDGRTFAEVTAERLTDGGE